VTTITRHWPRRCAQHTPLNVRLFLSPSPVCRHRAPAKRSQGWQSFPTA